MRDHTAGEFLLVYSSQTGQAQAIAEELTEKCLQQGLSPSLHCISQTDKKFWLEKEKCMVLITSTTGDGEPPETALKFWRRLKKKTHPHTLLSQLNYALLGLGDSNYTNFCRCGHSFNDRLLELGAKPFLPPTWADDATGLEEAVEPWIDCVIPALRKHLGVGEPVGETNGNATQTSTSAQTVSGELSNGHNDGESRLLNGCETSARTPVESPVEPIISPPATNGSDVPNPPNGDVVPPPATDGAILSDLPHVDVVPPPATDGAILSDPPHVDGVTNGGIAASVNGSHDVQTDNVESLTRSMPPLCDSNLTVPQKPAPFLSVEYLADTSTEFLRELPLQNGHSMPTAETPVSLLPITGSQILTSQDALKTTILLQFSTQDVDWLWEAGDSVSIICPNSSYDVESLLARLRCSSQADLPCEVAVLEGTLKKRAAVPDYYNQRSTLRHILTHCCDVRAVPTKACLRGLVDFTSDTGEQRRLQELCSKQGMAHYTRYVRQPGLNILDVLHSFPSCQPPLERVLEHLPRLLPRPYSICSSKLQTPDSVQVAFNIVEIEEGDGRSYTKRGVATGWLASLVGSGNSGKDKEIEPGHEMETDSHSICSQMKSLSLLEGGCKIPVYLRNQHHFRLPADPSTPVILIGPGTGVAPFVGFLRQRDAMLSEGASLGEAWLFYGCRHRDKDFLFKEELLGYESSGVLNKLIVSYSREQKQANESAPSSEFTNLISPETITANQSTEWPRYVQDNLRLHGSAVANLVRNLGSFIYVCGDAKGMAKGVNESFLDILRSSGLSEDDARVYIMQMRLERRYREDVWT